MKKTIIFLLLIFSVIGLFALDIKTTDGIIYKDVTIVKESSLGIRFTCNGESRFVGIKYITQDTKDAISTAKDAILKAKEIEENKRLAEQAKLEALNKPPQSLYQIDQIKIGEKATIRRANVNKILDENSIILAIELDKIYFARLTEIDAKDMLDDQKLNSIIVERIGTYNTSRNFSGKSILDLKFIKFCEKK